MTRPRRMTSDWKTSATPLVRHGFTVVELLVAISIIGMLMALILPAVQHSRESARGAQCRSQLKQLGQALHNFEASHSRFPAGDDFQNFELHSWCTRILPYIDQANLYANYDWTKPWDDSAGNAGVTGTKLPLFVCPSSPQRQNGPIDYGGNFGSSQTGLIPGLLIGEAWESGALVSINVGGALGRIDPTRLGEFADGLSSTFLVLECTERQFPSGYWGCGGNTMGIEYPINSHPEGETIKSNHPQGGHTLFCDGHVAFYSNSTDLKLLGRLSTRAGDEVAQP